MTPEEWDKFEREKEYWKRVEMSRQLRGCAVLPRTEIQEICNAAADLIDKLIGDAP